MSNQGKDHEPGTQKTVTIMVNGRKKEVAKSELTFADVVALADNLPSGPNIVYTITFTRGHGDRPEGHLVDGGEPVKVKEGMIFNVAHADKS